MNKSAISSINFSIVLFLTSLSLFGMSPKHLLLRGEQLTQHPHDLARINRNFAEGIFHYQKGNKAVAEVILFSTYTDADKKNLISCVDETLLTSVRSMICATQCQHGFYETALSFADDLKDQQKIYHGMAQKAYKDGNFALGQKYVQHAFTTKQAGEIIDYEQKYMDEKKAQIEALQAKQKYEYSTSSTLGVDLTHPDFACLLSVMSLNDNQENPSYAQSLEYAKKAVKSLTRTSPDTGLSFRYTAHFPATLRRLCTEPTDLMIKNTALVLQKYYDVISALKTKNHARIKELSALYKTENTVEAIPLQLLCSGMDTDHLHTVIQNFTIDNPEFAAFYTSSEGKIAIPILKWALPHLKLSQKEKDLYHIFLGGYEYHSKKIEDSVAHIKQCSDYDKDIYLRALSLKMANPEVYYEEMSLLLPLLQKSLSQPEKNVKIVQAHKIIATQCDYNPSLPIQKIVSACEKITLSALSSKATDPFEHGYMLLARADAHKKNGASSAEQEKVKTLTSYFLFFDALSSNDQKKLDQFFSAKAVNNDIRFIVLKNFRSKNQNGIKDIIFEDTSFEEFILSDAFFIEELLKDILNRPTTLCKIAPEDIHYILGGIASVKGNYGVALEHFLHCNKKDEYTLAKIIEATNIKDMLTPLQEYVSLVKINASKASNNPNKRKVAADELIKKIMSEELIDKYVQHALRQGNFVIDNQEFATFCTSSEGRIAIPILECALHHFELSQKEKDLCHVFLGGYEYHRNKCEKSIAHIEKCSNYDKDIYLQALSLKIASPAAYYQKMLLLLPLLQKSLSTGEKTAKIAQAHGIIAAQCKYNPSLPIQEIVSTCEKITLCATSSNETNPFEHGYMLLARADAHKKNDLLSAEQEKIKTLSSYFLFFDALNSNDQKKLAQFFSAKDDNNDIRFIVLKNFRSKNQNGIKDIIFEDNTSFEEFILSDTFFIEELLKDILNRPNTLCKIAPEDIHYLLGGIASVKENYGVALEHFLHCNKNDEYTLAKIIEATNIKDMLTPLQEYVSLVKINASKASNNPNKRKVAADELIKKIMNEELIDKYVQHALRQRNYKNAYEFIASAMQLKIPETYLSLCAWFFRAEKKIAQFPTLEYHRFLTTPYRINLYNIMQENAHKKNHIECFCHYLALALLENREHEFHTEESILDLERKVLRYLSCFLNHENIVEEQSYIEELVAHCGDLANNFGFADCSHELIDLAIKCGNPNALRSKAVLLHEEHKGGSYDEIAHYLERHSRSDDEPTERAVSYNDLGRLLDIQEEKDPQTKKAAFDFFKAAADLGNYQYAHLLAQFYHDGIEGYLAADREETLFYLEKTIALKQEDCATNVLRLHAHICYETGRYKQAADSLEKLITNPGKGNKETISPCWMMGLTQLHLLDEDTNLSQDVLKYLKKAYELLNINTSVINYLTLRGHRVTMNLVEKKINHILDHCKIDALSLEFCSIIGSLLFQQCSDRPTTDPDRKCAISALVHAAQNGYVDAALWLARVANEEIKLEDKIYYLEMLSPSPAINKTVDITLEKMYPREVIGQARLICHFAEKGNEALLKKYLMQLYQQYMPTVLDFTFRKTHHSDAGAEEYIGQCLQIPLLIESTEAFLKNPEEADDLQRFSSIFLASLLAYSLEKDMLLKAAQYLEAPRTNFSQIQIQYMDNILGNIYYKLGCIERKRDNEKKDNEPSQTKYFEKGRELNNPRCIAALLPAPAQNIIKITPMAPQQTLVTNREEKPTTLEKKSELPSKHPAYERLVDKEIKIFTDKDFDQILSAAALSKCNEPKKCLLSVIMAYARKKSNNADLIMQYIEKAIAHGTIESASMKIIKFKDNIILSRICDVITKIIVQNQAKHLALLPKIKKELIKHGMNIKDFEDYYHFSSNINIAKLNSWKKAK